MPLPPETRLMLQQLDQTYHPLINLRWQQNKYLSQQSRSQLQDPPRGLLRQRQMSRKFPRKKKPGQSAAQRHSKLCCLKRSLVA